MDRFQRSWQLFKTSLIVMMQNKKLLAFPVLITTLSLFLVLLFLVPVAFQPTGHGYTSVEHWKAVGNSLYKVDTTATTSSSNLAQSPSSQSSQSSESYGVTRTAITRIRPLAYGYFALMYFTSMFLATFLNVAFYKQILNALSGQPVSIMGGIQFACTKWKIILMWTLFAGLVGFIIKMLAERFGFIGEMVMKLIGAVWSVACVFVIPVIITEEETANPVVVLKKSALTLTKTWGESLIGYAGVSIGGGIIMVASLFYLAAGIALSVALHSFLIGGVAVASWLLGMCVLGYLSSVASQIFRCALFLYATQGNLPQPYNAEMMNLAWKMKKN
ncbi:MAG: hypothetical protein JWR26_1733 [Pedosphaera sp.]|nr:hypothetical protein [Pedosphaera sp.]